MFNDVDIWCRAPYLADHISASIPYHSLYLPDRERDSDAGREGGRVIYMMDQLATLFTSCLTFHSIYFQWWIVKYI